MARSAAWWCCSCLRVWARSSCAGSGLTLAQRHAALKEAVRDAEVTTALLATRVVQPAIPRGPLTRLDADQGFDRVVRERVLGAPITEVLIADETGLVVYAIAGRLGRAAGGAVRRGAGRPAHRRRYGES